MGKPGCKVGMWYDIWLWTIIYLHCFLSHLLLSLSLYRRMSCPLSGCVCSCESFVVSVVLETVTSTSSPPSPSLGHLWPLVETVTVSSELWILNSTLSTQPFTIITLWYFCYQFISHFHVNWTSLCDKIEAVQLVSDIGDRIEFSQNGQTE